MLKRRHSLSSRISPSSKYRAYRSQADSLGQIFTPACFADRLIANIGETLSRKPQVLDLGAGRGALTAAAFRARPLARAQLVEIDPERINELASIGLARVEVLEADVLTLETSELLNPSLILSNPPFGHRRLCKEIAGDLAMCGLEIPSSGGWVRTDAAFVAKAWSLARNGTTVGFITASPMMTDPGFRSFRSHLLPRLRGAVATRLPSAAFPGVEVSAFALTGQRAASRRRGIVLQSVDYQGEVDREVEVSIADAIESLDINYHLALRNLGMPTGRIASTLGSIGCVVQRGSRSQAQYRDLGLAAFHTSSFTTPHTNVTLKGARAGYNVASAGDILLSRVGTRCLDRHARVVKGAGLFTDCVYRLAAPERYRSQVWKTLSSGFGVEWRLANALGSCAKYLTVDALLGMPVDIRK